MSSTAIIRALISSRPEIAAIVPAARVYAGVVPQGAVLPAIGVTEISSSEEPTVARRMSQSLVRSRAQVTIYARDYAQMKQLLRLCKLGQGVHTGAVQAAPGKVYQVRSVLPYGVGPEFPPGDDNIYEQSRDFMVTFMEAN